MDETQIQQSLKNKYYIKTLILLLILSGLSSCVQLRYTDYGRPFDFLKSKNQYHATHNSNNDTASFNQAKIFVVEDEFKEPVVINDQNSISDLNPSQVKQNEKTEPSAKEAPSTIKTNQNSVSTKQQNSTKKKNSSFDSSNTTGKNVKIRGPGWWDNFWSGFWNFVLKWLLIFLCFFILLALIIWGIYLLLSLLAGPVAGAIFLVIVLTLFYILMETS